MARGWWLVPSGSAVRGRTGVLFTGLCAWLFGWVSAAVVATSFGVGVGSPSTAEPVAAAPAEPRDLATQLRYIGRDTLSGMPAPVDDAFIAEQVEAIERYGKDEQEPIPPPPVEGVDIASIRIPAMDVESPLGRYGVDKFGRLDVPQDRVTVGWNPGFSDLPGQGGATFFAAHYEYAGAPGVFFELNTLMAGDEIEAILSDGTTARYAVTSTLDYPLGAIDMGAMLMGREGVESITLMTCSGPPNEGIYPLRTVVLAERVD